MFCEKCLCDHLEFKNDLLHFELMNVLLQMKKVMSCHVDFNFQVKLQKTERYFFHANNMRNERNAKNDFISKFEIADIFCSFAALPF